MSVAKSYHKEVAPVLAYCAEFLNKILNRAHFPAHRRARATPGATSKRDSLPCSNVHDAWSSRSSLIRTELHQILRRKACPGHWYLYRSIRLAWALAVPDDGEVYTFDIDHTNYKKYGVPVISKCEKTFKKIHAFEGSALEALDKLIADGQSGTFDFAFIDADKANYSNYYDRSVTLLRKGGVIFVDNSLWSGSVCDPAKRAESESTQAIHDANDKIYQDDRTYSALLNLGDGTHVAFKK
ncbi:Protein CBG12150 [Caenorhabditis briggsae]|uniref:Protein CBG12150 n=1 Tax=Caenorhabditis briggsae TaxID=6238 RepID=A8XEV4_CAEBR|nr:Protein CBG12150 [Caenorhabditis briggsae]CAP31176.1 Protein CBG12150 [Caenorhabditis briggsae]